MAGQIIHHCAMSASAASTHAGDKLCFNTSLAVCTGTNLARCQHTRDVRKVYNVAEEDSYTRIEFWLHRPPLLQSRRHLQMGRADGRLWESVASQKQAVSTRLPTSIELVQGFL